MPLPLLVPAAVAASTEVSLLTLITSTTLALTGGFALGTEFSASPPIEHTESEMSFGSFIAQLKAFPQQTKELMADVFSDFNEESKHIKDTTDKLTTLSGRLEGVVQTTQKSVVQLQRHVHEPLIKVGQTLTITQRKTEHVTNQLLAAQTELADANKKISVLAATLKKQQDSIVRLNAEISPLTSALALQTKEKEKAQKKLAALTLTYNQQQEGVKKTLQTQLTLNKGLTERLHQLELEVGRLEAQNLKLVGQKHAIEELLLGFKNQQAHLLKRIEALEEECLSLTKQNEGLAVKSVHSESLEDQVRVLSTERQELQETLKQQLVINKQLEEAIKLLELQATSLEESLTRLKQEHAESKKKYQELSALSASLNQEAQEQEALIQEQAKVIEHLTQALSTYQGTSPRFFPKATPPSTETLTAADAPSLR